MKPKKIEYTFKPLDKIPSTQALNPDLPTATCLRCGHVWNNRTANPRQCPNCKSPRWNQPRKKEAKP